MKCVYVLLVRSQTVLSKLIRLFTGDQYTHAAVAFDAELDSLCSFARKHAAMPLPAGLVHEALDAGYYDCHRYIPCALYALPMREENWTRVKARAEEMLRRSRSYRYSVRGLAMCRLGRAEVRPEKYFCSQFVGEVLEESGAVRLQKPPALMRPQDLASLPEMKKLYQGRLSGLMHDVKRITACVDF